MNKIIFSLFVLLLSGFLLGCAPRTLNVGAENVHVYDHLAPKSCRFLGNIMNQSVHGDLYLGSSVEDLQKDDINFLKNEGAKLGGNVVVVVSHSSYETKIKGYGKNPRSITINEHGVVAKAYLCPLGLIPKSRQRNTTHVKINETPLI